MSKLFKSHHTRYEKIDLLLLISLTYSLTNRRANAKKGLNDYKEFFLCLINQKKGREASCIPTENKINAVR